MNSRVCNSIVISVISHAEQWRSDGGRTHQAARPVWPEQQSLLHAVHLPVSLTGRGHASHQDCQRRVPQPEHRAGCRPPATTVVDNFLNHRLVWIQNLNVVLLQKRGFHNGQTNRVCGIFYTYNLSRNYSCFSKYLMFSMFLHWLFYSF